MTRSMVLLATVCVVALAVSGCGRKGNIEPPSSSAAPAAVLPA